MISKRIKTIASLIKNDESVVDVGCDHAYLALSLRNNGHKAKIFCVDNKIGPLSSANDTISTYNLDNCETILSDGLSKINASFDIVVMAGMGYHNVISIIDKRVEKAIIQVNTDVDKMRKWLTENGFEIIDEIVIFDIKYYEILMVRKGKQQLNELEISCGPINLQKKDEVFLEYINYRKEKLQHILQGLSVDNKDYNEIEKKIKLLEAV